LRVLIVEYLDATGRSPFAGWFDELDSTAAAKVTVALTRIELGNLSNVKRWVLDSWNTGSISGRAIASTLDDMATTRSCCSLAAQRDGSSGISQRRIRDGLTTKSGVHTRNDDMALTREFKDTVKARAARDPNFREALLIEAAEQLLAGDLETGKAVLRDYINATVGFERLARETGTPSKSLMRMLGPKGNPRASNLLAVLGNLQRVSGVHLAVAAGR
jgi:DNA-binding phage protein